MTTAQVLSLSCIAVTSPTLPELRSFQGRIKIVREIGTHHTTFGILLLEDKNGARVAAITDRYRDNAEQINTEILREWLNGRGKQPVTWGTLIGVLRDTELDVLAGDIEAMF